MERKEAQGKTAKVLSSSAKGKGIHQIQAKIINRRVFLTEIVETLSKRRVVLQKNMVKIVIGLIVL